MTPHVANPRARALLREIAIRARELEVEEARRPGRQLSLLERLPEPQPLEPWEPLIWEEALSSRTGDSR